MDSGALGNRMKKYYEEIPKIRLMRRCPVAIRIDGKSFHTFTRGFDRPFDEVLIKTMQQTMKYLCENIQGCIIGYTQSDEITLILTDYETFTTDAWFEYEVQKLCSISASMATKEFNRIFQENVNEFIDENKDEINNNPERKRLYDAYMKAIEKGAMFDSRCFNIPKEEVTNLIYWRQQDASRNSIQMVGRANFSHRQLQNKSCNDICNMLMTEKGIDWENFKVYQKRGSCCIKRTEIKMIDTEEVTRSKWVIDKEIPVFKGDDRAYIDELI